MLYVAVWKEKELSRVAGPFKNRHFAVVHLEESGFTWECGWRRPIYDTDDLGGYPNFEHAHVTDLAGLEVEPPLEPLFRPASEHRKVLDRDVRELAKSDAAEARDPPTRRY